MTRTLIGRLVARRQTLAVGLALTLFVSLHVSGATAQTTRTWQGVNLINNDWFSQNGFGNNWTTSVPDTGGITGEIARIQSVVGGTPQTSVSLGGNVTIRGLEMDTQIGGQVNVDLTISNATMTINGSGTNFSRIQSLKTLTLNNGTIGYNLSTFNIDGTIVGNGTLNSPFTFNGPLGGSFIAQGGTLNLNGNIATTGVAGNLTANGGTLALNNITIPSNANVAANNGGTVQYSATSAQSLLRPITQTSGTGNFTKTGGATLVWNATGSNYSGTTSITGGTLQLGTSNVIPDASSVSVGGGTVLNVNNQSDTIGSLAGGGNVTLGSGALVAGGNGATTSYSGQISGGGSFTKTGGGTMTLTNSNGHTGGTNINGGGLAVASDGNLGGAGGGLGFNGGTLRTDGAISSSRAVSLGAGGGTINTNGFGSTLNGNITGAGGLTKTSAGLLSLGGTNSYLGATQVNQGGLSVLSAASLSGTSSIDVATAAALTLVAGSTVSTTQILNSGIALVDGAVTGDFVNESGGLLSGSGSISGLLSLDGGSELAPGNSPGTLAAGSSIFGGGAAYDFEINDAAGLAGIDSGWDLLDLGSTLTISASSGNEFTLKLTSMTLANAAGDAANFDNTQSYSWAFVTAPGGITGFSPDAFILDDSGFSNDLGGGTLAIGQVGNSLVVSFVSVPEPTTLAMALVGVVGTLLYGRRRHAKGRRSFP
jgi:fibronectin-binding autotransporter adhesin